MRKIAMLAGVHWVNKFQARALNGRRKIKTGFKTLITTCVPSYASVMEARITNKFLAQGRGSTSTTTYS